MRYVELCNKVYHAIGRRFRAKRLYKFENDFPVAQFQNVIDVGGTPSFWGETARNVTLVNVTFGEQPQNPRVKAVVGSGMDLPFADNEFDLAFSNSTIEHLRTLENQTLFANELRRVGKQVYCQTPNRWFPFEVHYLSLFLHWYPRLFESFFIMRYLTGWGWLVRPTRQQAAEYHTALKILTFDELHQLRPDCVIHRETFLGMTKSITAIRRTPELKQ